MCRKTDVFYGIAHLHGAIEVGKPYFTICFYTLLSHRRERTREAGKESGKVGRKWKVSALIYTHVKLQTSTLGEQGVRRVLSSYVVAVVLSQIDRKEFSPEGGVPLRAFHVTNVSFPSRRASMYAYLSSKVSDIRSKTAPQRRPT
jgi:hypothetical protein